MELFSAFVRGNEGIILNKIISVSGSTALDYGCPAILICKVQQY